MLSVAFQDAAAQPAEPEMPVLRRLSVTAVLDTRKQSPSRRSRTKLQTISVPVYSRITYRAGTVTVR